MMYKGIIKPVFDWLLALLALILLIPVFLIVITAIKVDSKGPAFFSQKRVGKSGRIFMMFKLRSMVHIPKTEMHSGILLEDDARITRVGRFIRKTSLDELPQLVNILKGEMSFIGPRPPLDYYPKRFEEYDAFEVKRFNVKPGISGLAQLRRREVRDWSLVIPIDVEYVEKQSLGLDVSLFLSSLFSFFKWDNIYPRPALHQPNNENSNKPYEP